MTDRFPGFKLSATIDYVKIAHGDLPSGKGASSGFAPLFEGRVNLSDRAVHAGWMTVHDPTLRDLQMLVDDLFDYWMTEMEVAVDFVPLDAGTHLDRLYELQRDLQHRLAPQRHVGMASVRRKQADPVSGRVVRVETLALPHLEGTRYWADRDGKAEVKLYLKTIDDGKTVEQPFVRLEVKLMRGALQWAGCDWVGMLPRFVPHLRQVVSPYFWMADGLRPAHPRRIDRLNPGPRRDDAIAGALKVQARLDRAWARFGAPLALRRENVLLVPDRAANLRIGKALNNLQVKLGALQLPKSVPDYDEWYARKAALFLLPGETRPSLYRRGKRSPTPGR